VNARWLDHAARLVSAPDSSLADADICADKLFCKDNSCDKHFEEAGAENATHINAFTLKSKGNAAICEGTCSKLRISSGNICKKINGRGSISLWLDCLVQNKY